MGETIEHKLVMLPTGKASDLVHIGIWNKLTLGRYSELYSDESYQHLYIVSNKEITENCKWYIDDTNTVRENVVNDIDYWAVRKNYKDIIASTDKSLTCPFIDLQASQWILDYFNENKKLPEIEFEYAEYPMMNMPGIKIRLVKTDKKGSVIIKKPKQHWLDCGRPEMYSREEVGIKCTQMLNDYIKHQLTQGIKVEYDNFDTNKWINENLK